MKHLLSFNVVSVLLFLWTIARACLVVSSDPIIGYGNSYDFLRQSACTGLWQHYDDRAREAGHPEGPVNFLVNDGDERPDLCVHSIDNVFPAALASFHGAGQRLDFRELGGFRIAVTLCFAAGMLAAAASVWTRTALTLVIALCLGDIALLAYANTLYLEVSVIAGCLLSIGAIVSMYGSPRLSTLQIILACVGLTWLGFSKQQYSACASVLACFGALILICRWRRGVWAGVTMLVLAGLMPIGLAASNPATDGSLLYNIDYANKTDTFLEAVLPAATNATRALDILGLPASCEKAIGKSWYSPGMHEHHACPEVRLLSRRQLLPLFAEDPATLSVPFVKGLVAARPFKNLHLGMFEDPKVGQTPIMAHLQRTSLSSLLARVPLKFYRPATLAAMALGLVAFATMCVWLLTRRRQFTPNATSAFVAMFGLGGVLTTYAIASSVFGDGYCEITKHAVALVLGLAFQLVGVLCGVSVGVLQVVKNRSQQTRPA